LTSREFRLEGLGLGGTLCRKLDLEARGVGGRVATPGIWIMDRRRTKGFSETSELLRVMVALPGCCIWGLLGLESAAAEISELM
jgi:hypothetical protein